MNGKHIVALHGNLGSVSDWDALGLESLHAIDLWDYSGKNFLDVAATMPTRFGEGKPVLMGYSLGGRLALKTFCTMQGAWSAAIFISAHPGLRCVEDRVARRISDEVWADRAREMEWSKFLESWDSQGVLDGSGVSTNRDALESRREQIALAFENWSLGKQQDFREYFDRLWKPILWITGEKDEKFTALAAEMAELNSCVRHEVISDCGHRVLFEKPEELACLIDDFRDRLID